MPDLYDQAYDVEFHPGYHLFSMPAAVDAATKVSRASVDFMSMKLERK